MAVEGGARAPVVNVLMYHSIAPGDGPTSIAPAVFAAQMETLARSGCAVVPLAAVGDWMAGIGPIADRAVAITFDDGFTDFIPAARILSKHGFPSTMFLPTGCMGDVDRWSGAAAPGRAIMTWADAVDLASEGVTFGGHTVSHPDLTTLSDGEVEHEVGACRADIERHLGIAPSTFAAPYGAANARVRSIVARHFPLAVTTELSRPVAAGDLLDIPRLEMFYFRDIDRWEAHLAGRGEGYLALRRMMRRAGRIWSRATIS